jgi:hypothetical protein
MILKRDHSINAQELRETPPNDRIDSKTTLSQLPFAFQAKSAGNFGDECRSSLQGVAECGTP